jgi:hypothetical protein
VLDLTDPTAPRLEGLLQDPGRSNSSQPLAGATGVAFDKERRLAFVAAEHARVFSVISVTNLSAPVLVGRVLHPALAGEAVAYDSLRRRAFVVSRSAAALVVVDVRVPTAPAILGIISSKHPASSHDFQNF